MSIKFDKKKYSNKLLIQLYKQLLLPRLIEQKMLILLRQGKISKWFAGIGQEAISVGVTAAIQEDEYILPLHRNLGVFTTREVPLRKLFAQFLGKASGFTKGRDRSFHFGSKPHHIIGMISHLGPQLSVADGIALRNILLEEKKITVAFTGDGGSSEGEFHEALNVASVWNLPVIFLVENNGYSISTPTSEQFAISDFSDKGAAYGIDTYQVDGNNILEVYSTVQQVAKNLRRSPRPVLIEAKTFRIRGHEEASGTKYVPKDLLEKWAKRDPVENYEAFLLKNKILNQDQIDGFIAELQGDIDEALESALNEEAISGNLSLELDDVFAHVPKVAKPAPSIVKHTRRYVDAIHDALDQSMKRYDQLVLMGQDIAEYGGVFKVTEGLMETYGKDRVRNTPLCESAIVGVGFGLAIAGGKSVIEMQFADFVTCAFNQVVNNLAKSNYRWGQAADVVVRMPTGAGMTGGPYHSQSNEAWFFHTPGLKIVYPSTAYDAKGLLCAAIQDPNPVLYFEHKALYRSVTEEIPEDYYTVEIGKGRVAREGEDVSIITYGAAVHWATEVAEELESKSSIEIIDLRSLAPIDYDIIKQTVEKTGRILVLTEDTITGSICGDIAAWIGEELFEFLDAPVKRLGSLDTPIPFAKPLEDQFLSKSRLKETLETLLSY